MSIQEKEVLRIAYDVETINDWYDLPEQLREDARVFMIAFKRIPSIFKDAPQAIKNNDEVVKEVLNINGYFIEHCPEKYKTDIKLAHIVAHSTPLAVSKFNANVFNDRALVETIAKTNPKVFVIQKNKIPQHYYDDFGIMDHLIYKMPEAFCVAGEKYRSDIDNIEAAMKQNPTNYRAIPDEIKLQHPELALKAVEKYGVLWRFIPDEFKHDREFVNEAIDLNPEVIHYFRNDNDIQL